LDELEKPYSKQEISVDHVLEATKAAEALRKRSVIDTSEEEALRRAILGKFRSKVIVNTVEPRKLVKLARAVQRGEVPVATARSAVMKLVSNSGYSIETAFADTVEQPDFEHSTEQLADRLIARLEEHERRGYHPSKSLLDALRRLRDLMTKLIRG
jgi:hypothetical protein